MACPTTVRLTLLDRIWEVVQNYPDWSRAERENLDSIYMEIIAHCSGGNGNGYIREWCDRNLSHIFQEYRT